MANAMLGRHAEAAILLGKAVRINPGDAELQFNLAFALSMSGDERAALPQHERATRVAQDNPGAWLNHGRCLDKLSRHDEALASFDRALQIKPDFAEALSNRGATLNTLKRYDEALSALENALAFKDTLAEAWSNHGVALKGLERYEESLVSHERAVALNSRFAGGWSNRGVTLNLLQRNREAVLSFDRALELDPRFAEAWSNRSVALAALKRNDDALDSLARALKLCPDNPETHRRRASVLLDLKRLDEALASCDRALKIDEGFADAWHQRGMVLREMLEPVRAGESFDNALRLEPERVSTRWARAFVDIPLLRLREEDSQQSRVAFAEALERLEAWLEPAHLQNAFQSVGSVQPFYLAYQSIGNKPLLERYGALCCRLMAHWQLRQGIAASVGGESGRLRVGIVGDQIRNHSVWQAITRDWLFNFDPARFETHVYYLGPFGDEQTALAREHSTSFTEGLPTLEAWARTIASARLDAVIYPEIGMHALTTQLASMRLAPVQLVAWGHPETSGLPTIDYYVSADLLEPASAADAYTEKLVKLPHLGCCYPFEPTEAIAPDLSNLGIDGGAPLLVCPGTAFKYAPAHDRALVEIARQLGRCTFVFFDQNRWWTQVLKERLRRAFSEAGLVANRHLVFVPWMSKVQFHGLMEQADVYLDTIGFSGFNTAMQAVASGLPIVTCEGTFMRGRLAAGILRRMALDDLIAVDVDHYIALAVHLAQDAAARERVRERLRERRSVLYEDLEPVRALEEFLVQTCRQPRKL